MSRKENIPVYSLTIDELSQEFGVSVMSLVEDPAMMKQFIALSKQHVIQRLSVNNEKRIVTGVALRADFPVYRTSPEGKEYYFTVSQDEMQKITQKFMREKRGDAVNIEHNDKDTVENIYLIESFLLSEKHKLAYPEFEDIEEGSWMVSYKVENDLVWKAIKDGLLTGFSVELIGNLESKQQNLSKAQEILNLITIIDEISN